MHNRIHDTYKHHRHAKHNIKHKLILIFETVVIPPTTCRPSTNLPALDHVGNCIRTKSPFADWSSDNYKVLNKKSAPTVIMEDVELIKGGFTHPE
jgi:hypothetical protein